MPNTNAFIAHIRDLIANDDFKTAIQQLSALLTNSPQVDERAQIARTTEGVSNLFK